VNWKCRLGFHDWRHDGTAVIGGYVYEQSPNIEVQAGQRTVYFRRCDRCEKDGQYYPTTTQLCEIIRKRTRDGHI
jgi:hypothetical protein